MVQEISCWLRETAQLTLRYLGVGISFIPSGLIYAGLRKAGWDSPVSVALSLVLGFWIASMVWNRFKLPQRVPTIPPISKELAVLISDSMVENWADAVEARNQRAERLRVFLYHVELQGQSSEELRALLNRNALQVFGQIKSAPRRAM